MKRGPELKRPHVKPKKNRGSKLRGGSKPLMKKQQRRPELKRESRRNSVKPKKAPESCLR